MKERPDNLITMETISEDNTFLDLFASYIPIILIWGVSLPLTGRATTTSGGRWSENATIHFVVASASTVNQVSITILFRNFVSL
jgi:hypothetical protein